MGKKTKAKKRKAERARAHKIQEEQTIPLQVTNLAQEGQIPESVGSMPDDAYDGDEYNISFRFYIDRECELDLLKSGKAKIAVHALKVLRGIGDFAENLKKMTAKTTYDFNSVHNAGDYKKLYSGLSGQGVDSKGAHVLEVYIKSKKEGRMFIWVYPPKRLIYVLAVRQNHYRT